MLHGNTETLSFTSNPTFHKPQEFTKSMKTLGNQEQVLDDTLHVLLGASKKELAYITEVTDNTGLKRYEFAPEYVELLTWAMHLIVIGKPWESPRSSPLDGVITMTWSSLSSCTEDGCLVLRSIKDRLLVWILIAREAIEECSSSTGYILNMPRLTTMDQVRTQGSSPQAKDLHWELQLQLDRSAILPDVAGTIARLLLLEQLRRQENVNYTCHHGVANRNQCLRVHNRCKPYHYKTTAWVKIWTSDHITQKWCLSQKCQLLIQYSTTIPVCCPLLLRQRKGCHHRNN